MAPERCERAPVTACPLCRSEGATKLYRTRDGLYGGADAFDVVRCKACGLVYVEDRPSDAALRSFYPSDSYYAYKPPVPYALFESRALPAQLWYPIKRSVLAWDFGYEHLGGHRSLAVCLRLPFLHWLRRRATFRLDVLLPRYVKNGSLLEVGCGSGMYLALMKALGWKRVVGVDINQEALERARQVLDVEVHCGSLPALKLAAGSFDAVSLSHTLEHVGDPVALLTEVHRLLKPGGQLAIVVPNIDSVSSRAYGVDWFHLDVPRHLVSFNRTTLTAAVTQTGFTVKSLGSSPQPAYVLALLSLNRRARIPHSDRVEPRFPATFHARAALISLRALVACGLGRTAGEELLLSAVKSLPEMAKGRA